MSWNLTRPGDGAARDRVVKAAMELFGRQGFRGTTISQIEHSAGLSAGSGGLYRHFPSKRKLLEEGLMSQVDSGSELREFLTREDGDTTTLPSQIVAVARAGLRRLEHERDLNRLLMRDLAAFPELLGMVRDRELRTVHLALTAWITANKPAPGVDAPALAAVLMAAVSHYWIMADIFSGRHPLNIDEDRFLNALTALVAPVLGR